MSNKCIGSTIAFLVRLMVRAPKRLAEAVLSRLLGFKFINETQDTMTPITFDMWWRQEAIGINRGPYWPVHPASMVIGWRNVLAGVETSPGLMPGCYIQALGKIVIGDYTQIGPGVGLISSNHSRNDLREHDFSDIVIGKYCWLGMNSIILPGVRLGDFTYVGAGAVVTHSFPEGHCVVAGNPARKIRELNRSECIEFKSAYEYHGFVPKTEFDSFRKSHLRL